MTYVSAISYVHRLAGKVDPTQLFVVNKLLVGAKKLSGSQTLDFRSVLFVWCTVVYAHGRTYIDVSFSCLYGVPLVYARGRTHIDRAFTWCTIYVLHTHYVSSCLYGVPLCTHTVVLTLTCPSLVCMVYR